MNPPSNAKAYYLQSPKYFIGETVDFLIKKTVIRGEIRYVNTHYNLVNGVYTGHHLYTIEMEGGFRTTVKEHQIK